jgi:hypothetical protein
VGQSLAILHGFVQSCPFMLYVWQMPSAHCEFMVHGQKMLRPVGKLHVLPSPPTSGAFGELSTMGASMPASTSNVGSHAPYELPSFAQICAPGRPSGAVHSR